MKGANPFKSTEIPKEDEADDLTRLGEPSSLLAPNLPTPSPMSTNSPIFKTEEDAPNVFANDEIKAKSEIDDFKEMKRIEKIIQGNSKQ